MSGMLEAMARVYRLRLGRKERQALHDIATTGHRSAREVVRAQVLLKSADGWTEEEVAAALLIDARTVRRIRRRAAESGVLAAVKERPRSGAPRKLSVEQEARLIALACSTPPAGYCRWSIGLLAQEAIRRELVPELAVETVRQALQKTKSSPGKWKAGVRPRSHPSFFRRSS